MNAKPNSYDVTPYPRHAFPQTHPDTLATVATLFGMSPAPIEKCRVLEIGCGSGGNLMPMAEQLPESTFAGIDSSSRAIHDARAILDHVDLKNCRFEQLDVMNLEPGFGEFDYIICHGVFSWVPTVVQHRILDSCKRHLAPHGVAYVSYNTYPGWHLRGLIRDVMVYHAARYDEPAVRLRQAKALLEFLAQSVPTKNNAYGINLKREIELMQKKDDNYLLHDYLEEYNLPIYFHDFAARLRQNGLQYLGESHISSMWVENFRTDVAKTLRGLTKDLIQCEQYMDFVRNRLFRQTLICHDYAKLQRTIQTDRIRQLHVTGHLEPVRPDADLFSSAPVEYKSQPGRKITLGHPITKQGLQILKDRWPANINYADLLAEAKQRLPAVNAFAAASAASSPAGTTDAADETLALDLIAGHLGDFIGFSVRPSAFAHLPGPHPRTGNLTRYEAAHNLPITNLRHENVPINKVDRLVLEHLDGRDHAALVEAVLAAVAEGKLTLSTNGQPIAAGEQQRRFVTEIVNQTLARLAACGVVAGNG
ncbi:MAG: class I SAM-dependent methyltransferase [Planctomycetaceae bacterium]